MNTSLKWTSRLVLFGLSATFLAAHTDASRAGLEDITSSYSLIRKGRLVELRYVAAGRGIATAERLYMRSATDFRPIPLRGSIAGIAEAINLELGSGSLQANAAEVIVFFVENFCDLGTRLLTPKYVERYRRSGGVDDSTLRFLAEQAREPFLEICGEDWKLVFTALNEAERHIEVWSFRGKLGPFRVRQCTYERREIPPQVVIESHVG